MKTLVTLGLSLALVLAAGCATQYQDMTLGLGVDSVPMGGGEHRISAKLNNLNKPGDLEDFLLLRAAETALDHGAAGFLVVGYLDDSRSGAVIVPGSSFTTLSGATATTTQMPGVVVSTRESAATMHIRLANAPLDDPAYRDAEQIIAVIGPRVTRGLGRE